MTAITRTAVRAASFLTVAIVFALVLDPVNAQLTTGFTAKANGKGVEASATFNYDNAKLAKISLMWVDTTTKLVFKTDFPDQANPVNGLVTIQSVDLPKGQYHVYFAYNLDGFEYSSTWRFVPDVNPTGSAIDAQLMGGSIGMDGGYPKRTDRTVIEGQGPYKLNAKEDIRAVSGRL
ncbi:MAG: hypothetical protein K2X87_05020 [Gemmataceae bacterium]|nr:hypothetical protein [Gemmataceae bacterium]